MKHTLLSLILIASVLPALSASASDFRTQDNVDYLISLQSRADFNACLAELCELSNQYGTGSCGVVSKRFRIVYANLTTYAANRVNDLCVKHIEVDRVVEANPRIGRSN